MAQEIVFYNSTMQGAPSSTLTAAGTLLAVLDACLINGFNSTSITSITQSAGVATVTTSGAHGFKPSEWVLVAGATPSAYSGRQKVVTVPSSTTFTFAISSGTTSPATLSSATVAYPAAGWNKSSGGTNIAAYQGGSGSAGNWMQIEDNNPYADANLSFRTRSCAGWTALDSATATLGLQVKVLKLTGGWMVFADAKTCYIFFGNISGSGAVYTFAFGDMTSFYSGDAYAFFQTYGEAALSTTIYNEAASTYGTMPAARVWPCAEYVQNPIGAPTAVNLRGVSQIGGYVNAVTARMGANSRMAGSLTGYCCISQELLVPSLANNSVPVVPMFNTEFSGNNYTLRAKYRGIYWPLGGLTSGFQNSFLRLDNAVLDGVTQPMVLVSFNTFPNPAGANRQVAFQVDGAWG